MRVFENRVLRRIFGARRDKVRGDWRKLHNEELNDPYCTSKTVRVIKWRRMRWAGHVARIGERTGVYRVLVEIPEGKSDLEDPDVDERKILGSSGSGMWRVSTGSSWLRIGTGGGHL